MRKGVLFVLTAIGFGGAGYVAGYLVSRKKFFKLADIEVASVLSKQQEHDENLLKEYGIDRSKIKKLPKRTIATVTPDMVKPGQDRLQVENEIQNKTAIKDYSKIAQQYSSGNEGASRKSSNDNNHMLISDVAFGESELSCETLYYHTDGVIADNEGNLITNYEDLIGNRSLWEKSFKSGEVDAVYVRDLVNGIDYEILREETAWIDIANPAQKAAALDIGDSADDD